MGGSDLCRLVSVLNLWYGGKGLQQRCRSNSSFSGSTHSVRQATMKWIRWMKFNMVRMRRQHPQRRHQRADHATQDDREAHDKSHHSKTHGFGERVAVADMMTGKERRQAKPEEGKKDVRHAPAVLELCMPRQQVQELRAVFPSSMINLDSPEYGKRKGGGRGPSLCRSTERATGWNRPVWRPSQKCSQR